MYYTGLASALHGPGKEGVVALTAWHIVIVAAHHCARAQWYKRFVSSVPVFLILMTPLVVKAQTPSPLSEWQYSAGVPLEKLFESKPPDWQVRLGVGAAFRPLYDGADRYHVLAGPSIDIRYRDLAFWSTGEGIGMNVLQGENWRVSAAAVYDLGRRGLDDPSRLNGLGNINPAPEIKLAAEYVISKEFPLVVRAAVTRSFGGSNGWIADLGTYMPMPGSSDTFFWFAGPSVSFADSTYMNSWFGVNAAQAAASGYRPYAASAGLKSAGFGVTLVWFIDKHWFMTADGALKRLLDSAANSPITQAKTQAGCNISVNYQF
ncbi:MipA family MltA-interacting protein [Caballeronia arvi]|uniref:MipA family MltA-interacting protein n=2 Tax=Caballeronia arvi TaxID=1777135 RepID=A0A158L411_9BURK|nr:MipA family MltA-interacting protein [Caballeronia arvi]